MLEGTDIKQVQMQADDLKFADGELDLITMVRVMHHIPEPTAEFAEIARVLAPGGTAIIEVANYGHYKNRRRHKKEGRALPTTPVDIRQTKADEPDAIAFVNHNVDTVVGQLSAAGLQLESKLVGVQPAQPAAQAGAADQRHAGRRAGHAGAPGQEQLRSEHLPEARKS
ncbi:class I SAM-dependent methyltransferase [Aeromicrobium sp. UC242_57]|uniref:class I SAM-dependent methyltransferase n=1 Tax=Aeromicrobium sp. UC242_57 TaxID=3374624 RepID=UPI003787C0A1